MIPRQRSEHPGLTSDDKLRYRMTEGGVLLDKTPANETNDPFAAFSERSNETDEKAHGVIGVTVEVPKHEPCFRINRLI